ncbi:DUF6491 family protein [Phenylobacterium sp.]|uniref:DUF6491 family protein n=1 Tax=Phenylobacterium sp. TaxID=1871053 RepID=UPI0025DC0C84|nr:DUF6491 family protein [Phenylobacterium sp.]
MRQLVLAVAAATLLALGGAAPQAAAKSPLEPGAKPAKQCFWTHQVNNFASSDDRIVNVRVGVKDVYQFEMFGRCDDVDWANKIALVSRGSDYICSGLDAEIITHSPIGPHRCPVRNIRKLTAEEIAALPKHARP